MKKILEYKMFPRWLFVKIWGNTSKEYKNLILINILFWKRKINQKKNFKAQTLKLGSIFYQILKITKIQDNKSVLIELENSGWRFFSNDGLIGVETGLYFGNKNKYIENQNIFISGITQENEQVIEWQISKI